MSGVPHQTVRVDIDTEKMPDGVISIGLKITSNPPLPEMSLNDIMEKCSCAVTMGEVIRLCVQKEMDVLRGVCLKPEDKN